MADPEKFIVSVTASTVAAAASVLASQGQYCCGMAALLKDGGGRQDLEKKNTLDLNPLHMACMSGNSHMVGHLIEAKADVHAKTRFNLTPIQLTCCTSQDEEVLQLLLEARL